MPVRRARRRLAGATCWVLLAIGSVNLAQGGQASLSSPGRQAGELDRVQMHGNRLRGVAYRSTWRAVGGQEPARFTLKPTRTITLDGDRETNVEGGVYPIDVDGDGTFELLHFNGFRLMRVYGVGGKKLWQESNRSGRLHRDGSHRDTLAIFDVDGDRGQEIVHCWAGDGKKLLVTRDGRTGRVLKKIELAGESRFSECQLAAFQTTAERRPIILVAADAAGKSGCDKGRNPDYFARTIAFRADLTRLWDRATCAAGHYVWPLDANGDGRAEQLFVGKYLLSPTGALRCTLPGFGTDHVDSMSVADFDPKLPGLEALAVGGRAGTRFYSAADCRQRWTIGPTVIKNAQQTSAAYTRDRAGNGVGMLVSTKLPDPDGNSPHSWYALDTRGRVVGRATENVERFATLSGNANLDGAPNVEDRLASFGQVIDERGRRRLDTSWYWNLQRLTAAEKRLPIRERWARNPFAFDFDNDGRDELVVWGRHKLIVGTRADAGR